jgi:hypothetical protein
MKLFIPDLYEVLKCRVKKLTSAKESDDPADVLIRLKDVQTVCQEIEDVANAQALEIEKLRAEAEAKKGQ